MDPQDQGKHPEGLLGHPEGASQSLEGNTQEGTRRLNSLQSSDLGWPGAQPRPRQTPVGSPDGGAPLQALPASWV